MMVNLSKSWGGGEKWFLTVGEALQERGFTIIWVAYPHSALHQRLLDKGFPFEVSSARFSSLFNPFSVRSIRSIVKKHQPDMIMMNASHELKTFGLIAAISGVSHVIFRRGVSYSIGQNRLNKWYMDRIVTAFLANSHATFNAVTSSFPILLKKKHLRLNNGIRMSDWKAYPEKQEPLYIGMSARLAGVKGIDRAIMAMEKVVKEIPEAQLHILGDGPDREKLIQMSIDRGLEKEVVFHGFVKDVQAALSRTSIFLFTPKLGEGTSIALIEAMAMELPCVVFDTPAMAEVVANGESGFVVEDGNIEGLAKKLIRLLKDGDLRRKMGIAGRKRAEENFSLSKAVIDPLESWLLQMMQHD